MKDRVFRLIKTYPLVTFITFVYSLTMISVITWGIPNLSHPFNYHMDEWHQMQSVRAMFKHGTPNIPGAAHGTIFQFFLSGLYLAPFILFHVINPFIIKSAVTNLFMQEKIFVILRTNTLLFGIFSIITIAVIAKKYLKTSPTIAAFLFTVTPIWIFLSNFFKYDIALTFWICFSLLAIFHYAQSPTKRNFLLAAIPTALAFDTKVAGAPQILLYILSFFLFSRHWKKELQQLYVGLSIITGLIIIAGVPDLFFRLPDYQIYFFSNLVSTPQSSANYLLSSPWWTYLSVEEFPRIFGYPFAIVSLLSLGYWITKAIQKKLDTKTIFLLYGLLFYLLSFIPLELSATGNRLLVLLPFLTLLMTTCITTIWRIKRLQFFTITFGVILIMFQLYVSSLFITTKYNLSPQQQASQWIQTHIPPHSTIGIENIPIYQKLPDFIIKEFYILQDNPKASTTYHYQVITADAKQLPTYVIVTFAESTTYEKTSPKKLLIQRLKLDNYHQIATFQPTPLLRYFGNEFNLNNSGLNVESDVTIYKK